MTAPLQPIATATSAQICDGKFLVTNEPFAETHEQLGGFFLINAQNLDEAIAISAEHNSKRNTTYIPGAKVGTVEIRPVLEIAGIPAQS